MASAPPSTFGALLRRSRFATFDPQIGQVYASYGGDAARGNWGLKRPLALRKRQAYITIKSIDSKEQQTEWKHAEQQSRWIRMYDAVGIPPKVDEGSDWNYRIGAKGELQWMIDSEFATRGTSRPPTGKLGTELGGRRIPEDADPENVQRAMEEGVFIHNIPAPNVNPMSDKEFEAYLEKLRKLRPQFRKFLELRKAAQTSKSATPEPLPSFWEISRKYHMTDDYKEFLSWLQYKKYAREGSHVIEPQRHRFGGLTYANYDVLQSRFYAPPQPGRMIAKASIGARQTHTEDSRASYAGMVVDLPSGLRRQMSPMDWSRLARTGERPPGEAVLPMQFVNVQLKKAPEVVGPDPERLDRTDIDARVHAMEDLKEMSRTNPYLPGSREYVAHVEKNEKTAQPVSVFKMDLRRRATEPATQRQQETSAETILGTLQSMVSPSSEEPEQVNNSESKE